MSEDSEKRFPVLLRGIWFGINKTFRERLGDVSLTTVQYTVLRNLTQQKGRGVNQQMLSDLLSTNKSNLADLLDRMEKRGLVERRDSPEDQRGKLVSITPQGKSEYSKARKLALVLENEILDLFPEKSRKALFSSFERCNERLEEITNS